MPDASNPSALQPRDHPQDWIIEVDRIAAALHASVAVLEATSDEVDAHALVLLRQATEQSQELRDSMERYDLARHPAERTASA